MVLECVVNISEGRDQSAIDAIAGVAGAGLLDVHTDPDHHRTVLTLVGETTARAVTAEAVARLDLAGHEGAHPRIGVVDVVPFVALQGSTAADALAARDRFCRWAADDLAVPCFAYGPERSLPDVRARAFVDLAPTTGPTEPHPTAGAVAVGARPVLVAYNVWLAHSDVAMARQIAAAIRGPAVRALGLAVGGSAQVSVNLVAPDEVGPAQVTDAVAALTKVDRCELVGLLPRRVLHAVPTERWGSLDLAEERTIEARLEAAAG